MMGLFFTIWGGMFIGAIIGAIILYNFTPIHIVWGLIVIGFIVTVVVLYEDTGRGSGRKP
jgi:uncharacterized membrane protein YoaK (UPF0700 family)